MMKADCAFSVMTPRSLRYWSLLYPLDWRALLGRVFTVQSGIISPKAMDIGFSIEMVIWVAVGGRASLIGAIIGALVVNFARSFLSEKFPEVWLFFQGALFLLIVTVVPDGLVGWLRYRSVDQVRSLLGLQKQLATYPRLEVDPEVENERKNFE